MAAATPGQTGHSRIDTAEPVRCQHSAKGDETSEVATICVGLAYLMHDVFIVVQLVRSHTWACLHDRGHVVVPLLAFLGLVPIHSPAKVSGVDIRSKPWERR
jgi:hypothetical protein